MNDDKIKQKCHHMNKKRFIIEAIILGILILITGYGYMYIWCLGPFKDITPNVSAIQATIIHVLFVLSSAVFVGNLISYFLYDTPAIGAVYEYDLNHGKYSKKK